MERTMMEATKRLGRNMRIATSREATHLGRVALGSPKSALFSMLIACLALNVQACGGKADAPSLPDNNNPSDTNPSYDDTDNDYTPPRTDASTTSGSKGTIGQECRTSSATNGRCDNNLVCARDSSSGKDVCFADFNQTCQSSNQCLPKQFQGQNLQVTCGGGSSNLLNNITGSGKRCCVSSGLAESAGQCCATNAFTPNASGGGGTCAAQANDCGGKDKACCTGSGQQPCSSSNLTCQSGTCRENTTTNPTTGTSCGTSGAACCTASGQQPCGSGLTCVSNKCQASSSSTSDNRNALDKANAACEAQGKGAVATSVRPSTGDAGVPSDAGPQNTTTQQAASCELCIAPTVHESKYRCAWEKASSKCVAYEPSDVNWRKQNISPNSPRGNESKHVVFQFDCPAASTTTNRPSGT